MPLLASLRRLSVFALVSAALAGQRPENVEMPEVDGDWWRVAGNPDLGALTSEKQQPVDFAIWQAKDGTWQLWSCIRHTKQEGRTRLFHRWEGRRLTQANWKPMGVAMRADPSLGETQGGLQAPHVIEHEDVYYMFYGDWGRICLQRSTDGRHFERHRNERGEPDLFAGPYDNTRDPMVLRVGDLWVCYYTGHDKDAEPQCAVFCRTSSDLLHWSEPMVVAAGGDGAKVAGWYGGGCECPFVLRRGDAFLLFRNARYGEHALNGQFASTNPFSFGVDHDRWRVSVLQVAAPEIVEHRRAHYIAALTPELDGIRVAKLRWVPAGR